MSKNIEMHLENAWEVYKRDLEEKRIKKNNAATQLESEGYNEIIEGFCETDEANYDLDLPLFVINTMRMCKDRRLEFDEERCCKVVCNNKGNSRKIYDYDLTSEYQDEIRKTWKWQPISDKQLTWLLDMQQYLLKTPINKLKEICRNDGIDRSALPDLQNMDLLELSKQQASELMGCLFTLKNAIGRPASKKQLDYIRQMQDCITITSDEGGALTEEQLNELNCAEANDYINKHRRQFHAWQDARPKDELLLSIQRVLEASGQTYDFRIYANLTPEVAENLYKKICKELEEENKETTFEDNDNFQREKMNEQKEHFDKDEDEKQKLLYSLYSQVGESVPQEDLNYPLTFNRIIEIGTYVKANGGSPAPAIKRTKLLTDNQKKFLLFSGVLDPKKD